MKFSYPKPINSPKHIDGNNNPRLAWLFYAAGLMGVALINTCLSSMLLYRYDPGSNTGQLSVLVPAAIVGVAFLIGRTAGAFFQPLAGYLSDSTRMKWGRRRPYIAAGSLPMVVSFVLLFNPLISETTRGSSLYLLSLLSLFYLAMALYQVPYLAWLPELAPKDDQRVILSSWLAVATLMGGIFGGIGTPWLIARYGFAVMTAVFGVFSIVVLLLPLLTPESTVKQTERLPLLTVLKASWQNVSFRSYVMGISLAWASMSILTVCPPFFAIALLHKDIGFGALITALVMAGNACGMMMTQSLVNCFGKRRTFQFAMLWSGVGLLLLAATTVWVGPSLTLWLLLVPLSSLGLGCFMVLPNAMLPDVIEQDLKLGESAQAAYFGSRGLFRELSIGLGTLLVGLLLSYGNTAADPLGVQLAIVAAAVCVFMSAGFWIIYPIAK